MDSFSEVRSDATVNHSLTKLDISYLICEFLECAVHQVLHARQLYDERLFQNRKLYGLCVKKSLYPKLNDYIHQTVYSLQETISENALESFEIVFLDRNQKLIEKVVITFKGSLEVFDFYQVEATFRLLSVSILKSLSNLQSLPKGCEFDLSAILKKHTISSSLRSIWHQEGSEEEDCGLEIMDPIKSSKISPSWRIDIQRRSHV